LTCRSPCRIHAFTLLTLRKVIKVVLFMTGYSSFTTLAWVISKFLWPMILFSCAEIVDIKIFSKNCEKVLKGHGCLGNSNIYLCICLGRTFETFFNANNMAHTYNQWFLCNWSKIKKESFSNSNVWHFYSLPSSAFYYNCSGPPRLLVSFQLR
jgi:hypothetical protein